MNVERKLLEHEFEFPAPAEPAWSGQVERWYQLDAYAYGVADASHSWRGLEAPRPDLVILASPGGSTHTDRLFVQSGALSPSLFVHTLPNIRGSSFCQVMEWNGPVLCLQNDPNTRMTALKEATELLNQETRAIWVVSVERKALESKKYIVRCDVLFVRSEAQS